MRIKSQKDFFSGLLFMAAGTAFGWGATDYRLGTSAHMGPGYFPLLCSLILALIGLAVCIKSLAVDTADGERIGRWAPRPLVFIVLANMVFGILLGGWPALGIPAFGFVPATVATILVAAGAGPRFRVREATVLATVLALGSWLVFVQGLGMQLQSWPDFMAG